MPPRQGNKESRNAGERATSRPREFDDLEYQMARSAVQQLFKNGASGPRNYEKLEEQ
jgi:hypothetical protein